MRRRNPRPIASGCHGPTRVRRPPEEKTIQNRTRLSWETQRIEGRKRTRKNQRKGLLHVHPGTPPCGKRSPPSCTGESRQTGRARTKRRRKNTSGLPVDDLPPPEIMRKGNAKHHKEKLSTGKRNPKKIEKHLGSYLIQEQLIRPPASL